MKPNRIVITGGIASGKSEVTRYLRELGHLVIDADAIAHEVLADKRIIEAVGERFGPEVLSEGRVDHAALAEIVFQDEEKRTALEDILYPAIISELVERGKGDLPFVFYDIPLYYEKKSRIPIDVDAVWLVYAETDERIRRMQENRGMTEADARARLAAQDPLEKKIPLADFVLENTGTIEDLHRAVDRGLRRFNHANA